jgi:hypothetical protein
MNGSKVHQQPRLLLDEFVIVSWPHLEAHGCEVNQIQGVEHLLAAGQHLLEVQRIDDFVGQVSSDLEEFRRYFASAILSDGLFELADPLKLDHVFLRVMHHLNLELLILRHLVEVELR